MEKGRGEEITIDPVTHREDRRRDQEKTLRNKRKEPRDRTMSEGGNTPVDRAPEAEETPTLDNLSTPVTTTNAAS